MLKKGQKGAEVASWQRFLIAQGFGLKADGDFGAGTENATKEFQRKHGLTADGVVGAGTIAKARTLGFIEPAGGINTLLPASGEGFTAYTRENGGADQYGTFQTINSVIELGKKWNAVCPDVPLQIGDISRKGGGAFPPHSSHKTGRDVDVRPVRKDNKLLPCTITDAAYDAERTEKLVRLIRQNYPGAIILFNDKRLIRLGLTRFAAGHHNHLHISFR